MTTVSRDTEIMWKYADNMSELELRLGCYVIKLFNLTLLQLTHNCNAYAELQLKSALEDGLDLMTS